MKLINPNRFVIFTILMLSSLTWSQKKQEKIDTEEVNVVKSYTPTITDAFKVKETPSLNDEETNSKETVKYNVFSFPVNSTFTPEKGNAEGVENEKEDANFKNYATLGAGNYGTLNAELFATHELDREHYVAAMLRHLSSQGGIKGIDLNNSFYDTSVDATYGADAEDLSWNINLGYHNQIYHWYGLPKMFLDGNLPAANQEFIRGINPCQSYNTVSLDSKIEIKDNIMDAASIKFAHFTDAFGSAENRFYVKPSFKLDFLNDNLRMNAIVDYVGAKFEKNYLSNNLIPLEYRFTNLGFSPNYELIKDDWTMHLGFGMYYSMDGQNKNNKFHLYPQLSASHKIVGDLMIFYAGIEGGLEQNSYLNFVDVNPFLSPNLIIAPTDKKYELTAGLKGKFADNVSYNVRGSYLNENNKALFKSNDFSSSLTNEVYAYGNSLKIVYDDVKTIRFYGEIKSELSEDISCGVNGVLSIYNTKNEIQAWNLPSLKLNANLDYTINSKWYAGANLFYVGTRKDLQINNDLVYITPPVYEPIILKSYIDLNAHIGYKHNDRLTAFVKANNITNQAYQKWLNYTVQGFQIVVGANYKFDF